MSSFILIVKVTYLCVHTDICKCIYMSVCSDQFPWHMCEQSSQFCENQIHVKMLYVWTITLTLTKARVYLIEENQMCDIYQIVY